MVVFVVVKHHDVIFAVHFFFTHYFVMLFVLFVLL